MKEKKEKGGRSKLGLEGEGKNLSAHHAIYGEAK